jgi:hypothetical protein
VETEFSFIRQVDGQATFHNNEQFIRFWVIMPNVIAVENRQSQAAAVYAIDDHITVRLSGLCSFFP